YDLLVTLKDPRIPYFFQKGVDAAPNEFIALTSTETFTNKSALVHLNLLKADLPEVSFSYSEQLLLEAEAIAKGLAPGGMELATTRFRKGVEESLKSFGVPAAESLTYANSLAALTAGNFVKQLAEQQYLDLFMRPVEGWTQNRRSGLSGNEIPKLLTPPAAPVQGLFRRLLYRSEEVVSNPNTPKGLNIDTPMWFDK
ncbi:MAG: SusD/RagB family nutrient-binding outer membrane lipoprotein, partial [Saprospiraceae bacterium]